MTAPSVEGTHLSLQHPGTPWDDPMLSGIEGHPHRSVPLDLSPGHSLVLQPTSERSCLSCSSTLKPEALSDWTSALQKCYWVIPRFNREVRSTCTDGEKGLLIVPLDLA